MKTICKLVIILLPQILFSQTYFNKAYEINGKVHGATSVIEEPNGGYLLVGQEITTSYRAINLIKTNPYGDTLWTKSYPRIQFGYFTGLSNSLIKTSDNNYAFGGSVVDILNTTNTSDALLVKLNFNGDTLWTKKYEGAGFDNASIIHETVDSGFILMGVTQSFSNGPASDFYLIKTDKNGNEQWHKAYGTTLTEDCVSGQITLDGGFIMSGHQNNQLYIVKTDMNGNFQWQKTYPGTAGQGFIKQLTDSTYILVGTKAVTGLAYQAYMAKLTKTGNIIWQQTYGGAGDQQFYAIPIILNDGSIVCSGVSTL